MTSAAYMRVWPAGASPRYVAAREELLEAEQDLLDRVQRVAELRAWAPRRGWSRLRLLSSYGTTFEPTSAARTPTEASGRGRACSSSVTASSTTAAPPR